MWGHEVELVVEYRCLLPYRDRRPRTGGGGSASETDARRIRQALPRDPNINTKHEPTANSLIANISEYPTNQNISLEGCAPFLKNGKDLLPFGTFVPRSLVCLYSCMD